MSRLDVLLLLLAGLFFAPATPLLLADQIPYSQTGTIATQTLTYATGNGFNAFYLGSGAGYQDQVGVYDVQTGWNSGKMFDNKLNSPGDSLVVGTGTGQINAGDQLIFFIKSPDGLFASLGQWSQDGVNHAYVTNYSGGTINGKAVGPGLYFGMEDLWKTNADWNYNDLDFVVTGVSTAPVTPTPEPASVVLLATGVLAMAGVWKMRQAGL